MFGENILVVPKLERFSDGECLKNECPFDYKNRTGYGLRNYDIPYDHVEVFLPESEKWYGYYSKQIQEKNHFWLTVKKLE